MCGIFGVIFHGTPLMSGRPIVRSILDVLALQNVVRGSDATGIARVERDGNHKQYRVTSSSFRAVRTRRWTAVAGEHTKQTSMLMGHTRNGTHGANVLDNTHPFEFDTENGKLIGTHNGVIFNYTDFMGKDQFENDSKALYFSLSNIDPKKIPEFLETVDGSFALAFSIGGIPYLARNDQSPCYIAYLPMLDATIYSSIEESIKLAAAVADVNVYNVRKLKANRVYAFVPGRTSPKSYKFTPYSRPQAGFHISSASSAANSPTSQLVQVTKHMPKQTHSRAKYVPGLRANETLCAYENVRTTILCNECNKNSDETTLRVVNSKCVCSKCWEGRLQEYAKIWDSTLKPCMRCRMLTGEFVDVGEGLICCKTCWEEGAEIIDMTEEVVPCLETVS